MRKMLGWDGLSVLTGRMNEPGARVPVLKFSREGDRLTLWELPRGAAIDGKQGRLYGRGGSCTARGLLSSVSSRAGGNILAFLGVLFPTELSALAFIISMMSVCVYVCVI